MIQFEQVTKRYDQGPVVVDHLDLVVKPGELVTLIGSSGCGKTTTLKMVNRLIEMTSGQIRVNGRDIQKQDVIQLRRGIGYVIQQIGLFPNMTIGENITVVCRLLGWAKPRLHERSEELLRLVDMEPEIYLHRYPRELSGGQQQRIGVLRALAAEPEIILMDEPFGALDPITREQLQNELKNLQMKLHKTILFVTHDMNEALKLSDHIVLMRQGQIVQMGTPEDLLRRPANEFVVNFIGKDRMLLSPDEVTIADVMLRDPVTTEPGSRLAEALEKMHSKRVDSLMVVDEKKRLLGVVRIQAIQSGFNKVSRVGDLKLQQPVVIEAGRSVREAVQLMSQKEVGFLPVIDDAGRLQGLITRSSLVNILSDVLWAGGGTAGNESDATAEEESKRGDQSC